MSSGKQIVRVIAALLDLHGHIDVRHVNFFQHKVKTGSKNKVFLLLRYAVHLEQIVDRRSNTVRRLGREEKQNMRQDIQEEKKPPQIATKQCSWSSAQ